MKKFSITLVILSFTLCMSAQDSDSILLERTDMLKKEISSLNKKNNSLQAQINKIQKAHAADMQGAKDEIAAANGAIKENSAAVAGLEKAVQESEDSAVEGLAVLGDWTKKILTVLAILLCALFIILLILVITNRNRIRNEYLKLESRVDNVMESVEVELKNALKKQHEDMAALKAEIQKGKK